MQRRTQKLPKPAQDVLRPLYLMFKGIVAERAKVATNSPEYRRLTQQYDEVIRRRNLFSQQLRNGEFGEFRRSSSHCTHNEPELVAAHRVQKRVAVDDAEEQMSRGEFASYFQPCSSFHLLSQMPRRPSITL